MGSAHESENMNFDEETVSLIELGSGNYGCSHYRRLCKIRAPCCGEIYDCRHCHNEAKNSLETNPFDGHDIPRHEVEKVICSLCDTEQDVQQNCINCGLCMGYYFCAKCKFFDDDMSAKLVTDFRYRKINTIVMNAEFAELEEKKISFTANHAVRCCYAKLMKDAHHCVERAVHHNCPICFEFLFDTMKHITVLPCGHTIHLGCLKEMDMHYRYSCPICSKSICDMSKLWLKIDQEIASTPMPEMYRNKMHINASAASPTIRDRREEIMLLHALLGWLRWCDDDCT
ncbi:hypothetical protein EZV62_002350 [Acer yangbiense]|uniref:RING-type domain-containing protein n=1 Tax=Acer yangbiense TaxID=1000413 RepID=A0A5C7IWV1_9ROSI|nr:hypothetical protein EZV62_002350 [Acer yangbiense]